MNASLFLIYLIQGRVNISGGKHPFAPELQRFHRNGNLFKLILDIHEIIQFISGNLAIYRDLNEAVLLFLYSIQRCKGFQNDLGQILDLNLRHILLTDGTLIGTVVVA